MTAAPDAWRLSRPDARLAGWIVAIQLVLMAVSWPIGNFPTNDDWAYAHSVQWLLSEHRIRLSDWIAMNLLPQTLLGGAVAQVFGFSFSLLRVLTELVSLLAGLFAYGLFRVSGMVPRAAFAAALCLIALPWWAVLANSYMSDMYGMALAMAAAYCFVRQIRTPHWRWLLAGTVLAVVGVLQRQVVAVVPLAFFFGWMASGRPLTARSAVVAAVPFAMALAGEGLYQVYLAQGPGIPAAQSGLHERLVHMGLGVLSLEPVRVSWMIHNLLQMGGLLGASLAVWSLLGLDWSDGRRKAGFLILAVLFASAALATGWLPPYRPNNVLDAAGIGPFTLGRGMMPDELAIGRGKGLFWHGIGLLSGVGLAFLVVLLTATLRRVWRLPPVSRGLVTFMAACVMGYVLPFAVTDYFDRYLVFVIPFLLAWSGLLFEPADDGRQRWAAGLLLATGLLSAVALHDYFGWNRARWQAIDYAERDLGAGPANLDAGFEYNGFYNYESRKKLGGVPGKQWWWVVDDEFLVGFSPRPGYATVRSFPVARWLPTTPSEIFLLKRR